MAKLREQSYLVIMPELYKYYTNTVINIHVSMTLVAKCLHSQALFASFLCVCATFASYSCGQKF